MQRESCIQAAKRKFERWYQVQMRGADRKVSAVLVQMGMRKSEFEDSERQLCSWLQEMAILFRTFRTKDARYELEKRYIFLRYFPHQATKLDELLTKRLREVLFTGSDTSPAEEIDKYIECVENFALLKANMPVDCGRIEALIKIQNKLKALIFIVEKTTRVLDKAKPLLEELGKTDPFWLPCRSLPRQLVRILERPSSYQAPETIREVPKASSQCKTKRKRVTFADDELEDVHHFAPKSFELEPSIQLPSAPEVSPLFYPSPEPQSQSVPGPSILKRSGTRSYRQES